MRTSKRGSALLMVMWMSAALAAIAFSLATSVRGETDHTSTTVDDLRSYYIATGAIQRAIMDIQQGGVAPDVEGYHLGQPRLIYKFPTGDAIVEIIPETAKVNLNNATGEKLMTLLTALGVDPAHAQEVAAAIVDWRTPLGSNNAGGFDAFYQSQVPSFRARHASFEEIEELLSVKGITPDLYYGTYVRDTSLDPPQLVSRGGLKDCVSVYGSFGPLDVNGAAPAAMAAAGVPQDVITAVIARRPFQKLADFSNFLQGNTAAARGLRMGGNQIFTLRATARLRGPDGAPSDLRRSVAATIDFLVNNDPPVIMLRWYDHG
jgi:general secretion pathway protein K